MLRINRTTIIFLLCFIWLLSTVGCSQLNLIDVPAPPDPFIPPIDLTGEPVGGGAGYSRIVTSGNIIVSTKAELKNALASATSGQIIYVSPSAQIDLTGEINLAVPAGVTLAGNRGHDGSPGPLIYTTTTTTYPSLFLIRNKNVRFTGIRFKGPSYNAYNTVGLNLQADNIEVDNCEIYDWSNSGVHIMNAKNAYIHHNNIHHVQLQGLGYPVCLNNATALIEGNRFDYYRHAIAGHGNPGTGYEARYNWVGPNAISHAFDMHGGTDYCPKLGTCTQMQIIQAGDYLNIHHNTFMLTNWDAIKVRGIASQYVNVHDNWFTDTRTAYSFRFYYYYGGNAWVHDNVYGPNKTLVTELVTPTRNIYDANTKQQVATFSGSLLK